MKCPVCDQENSTLLCAQCGFDASRDYTLHPTFGPVGRVPSVSAKRKQWLDSQKKPMSSSDGPQFVDYRKMVSDAAKADKQHRQSRESQLLSSLQTANEQIAELMRDKRAYEKHVEYLNTERKALTKDLKQSEDYRIASSRQYGNEVKKVKQRDAEIAELKSQLETAQSRIAELEAALEAERNKGVLSRIFNR